jgi:hypothetical protein
VTLPRLRLLGYDEKRPNLRLIRLPEAEVEPSPVQLDRPPLDRCIRLEGWITFHGVWGVAVPLSGEAFYVGKYVEAFWTRSANRRALWLLEPTQADAPHAYVEYDGVARTITDRIELPDDTYLVHDAGEERFAYAWTDGWSRWRRGVNVGEPIEGDELPPAIAPFRMSNDPFVRFRSTDGDVVQLGLPPRSEGHEIGESPDGRWIAFDVDMSGPRDDPSFADIAHGRTTYEPVPHRLGLIDRDRATLTLAEGVFDNFASEPVWSFDSEWLVFAAPFTPHGLWGCRVAEREPKLTWIPFGGRAPVPLVNVSDLIFD